MRILFFQTLFVLFFLPSVQGFNSSKEIFSTIQETDSIGWEVRNGVVYILHKVDPQETLASIARKYKVEVEVIRLANPLLTDVLKINQIIKVPKSDVGVSDPNKQRRLYTVQSGDNLYKIARSFGMDVNRLRNLNQLSSDFLSEGQQLIVEIWSASDEPDGKGENQDSWIYQPALGTQIPIYHEVIAGETLYNISQKNKVSLDSIRVWNKLVSDEININDRLIVGKRQASSKDLLVLMASEKDSATKSTESQPPLNPSDLPDYKTEKGIGASIPANGSTGDSNKKLALHRSAKVGSYIKVINPNNKLAIWARVIGSIPDTEANKKLIVKLSQSACKEIGIVNEQFPVEVILNK